MRLRDRIKRWVHRALTLNDPALRGLWLDTATASGVTVTESTALRFAAVWACVRVISEDVATMPLLVYRRLSGGGKERAPDRKLYRLLHDEPNPEMSSAAFRETLQAHVLTWGNGYAEIERNGLNEPVALWPLDPSRVTPDRTRTDGRLIYRVRRSGTTSDVILTPNEILHVPGLGFDGVRGYSPIRMSAQSIGIGMAVEEFIARFYGQGFHLGGFIKHPKELAEAAYQKLKDDLKTEQGVGRSHLWTILEEGMEAVPLETKLKESELTLTRKHQVLEIARVYRVPPHKIMDLERATFSNIEEQSIDYVVSTLRPWLVKWEQEINRKLIPSLERRLFFAEHLIDGLLRGDAQSRSESLQTQFQNGALTIDEWREIENRNPVPDGFGKKHFVQLNMTTVDQAGKPKPEPPPPPMPPVRVDDDEDDEEDDRALLLVREALARIEALAGEVRALRSPEPVPPVAAPDKQSDPPPVPASALSAAHRGLLVDAFGRMVRREVKAIRKHAQRVKSSAEFMGWAESYYREHQKVVEITLEPVVKVTGGDVKGMAERYVRQAVADLRTVADVDLMTVLADKWMTERPAQIVDAIVEGASNNAA